MIVAWHFPTALDLAGPSHAGTIRMFKAYFCVDQIRDLTSGTAEDAAADAFSACIISFNTVATMVVNLNGVGNNVPFIEAIFSQVRDQLGWEQAQLLSSEFGVYENVFTVSSYYNQSTAAAMYTMVATAVGLHQYDPCSSQFHPANQAPVSVPVADIATAWVRGVNNWNAVEDPMYRDPQRGVFSRIIPYGYDMSLTVVDQIPHLFDVANVIILSTPESEDTTSLLKMLITSKSETNMKAGGFYSSRVDMEMSISRRPDLFLIAPTITITDPSPPYHKYGPTKTSVYLGSDPNADQITRFKYRDGWDGRVVSADTQTALWALHPLHMLSYTGWVGSPSPLVMDKPTMRILRRATEFAVELGLMGKILGDFVVSGVGLALFASMDTVGLRHPSCSHSKTSLDADCVERQLVECIGYQGGIDPKISRAPREANKNCFDNGKANAEASREAQAKFSSVLVGVTTASGIPCDYLLSTFVFGACLLDPVQFEMSTANPNASAVEQTYADIAKIGVRNCPLACTGCPFAVHECGVPNDRAWCSDLSIKLLPMLASSSFISPYKRAWERVLAKAALEEGVEMMKLGAATPSYVSKQAGWVTRYDPVTSLSSIWVSCRHRVSTSTLTLALILTMTNAS